MICNLPYFFSGFVFPILPFNLILVCAEDLFAEVDSSVIPEYFLPTERYKKGKKESKKGKRVVQEPEEDIPPYPRVVGVSEDDAGRILKEKAAASRSGKILRPSSFRREQGAAGESSSGTPPLTSGTSPSQAVNMCNLLVFEEGLAPWTALSDMEKADNLHNVISSVSSLNDSFSSFRFVLLILLSFLWVLVVARLSFC